MSDGDAEPWWLVADQEKLLVQPTACPTCPYLRKTPPGIWAAHEYMKLADYDEGPTGPKLPEALSVFHCHQENASKTPTVCRGWLSVHRDCVGVRMAQAFRLLDPGDVPTEPEPEYYSSGTEAMRAGLAGVPIPGREARRAIAKLLQRGAGREQGRD